jgi:hypothetical protein
VPHVIIDATQSPERVAALAERAVRKQLGM